MEFEWPGPPAGLSVVPLKVQTTLFIDTNDRRMGLIHC